MTDAVREPTGTLIAQAWSALGARSSSLAALEIDGPVHVLDGPLGTTPVATAAVAAALLAAAELADARGLGRPEVGLDTRHVADAVRSERFVRLDGAGPASLFDPLSAFTPTVDGWIRVHANYPHHRVALLRALGLSGGIAATDGTEGAGAIEVEAVQARIAARWGEDLEEALAREGGVGAAMRTPEQWLAHPVGAAAASRPLLDFWTAARPSAPAMETLGPDRPTPERPAAGLRVLDLTRVIAGPVGTRTLAALGADVLRLDDPHLPEIAVQHLDTGPDKRTALVDLRTPGGRAVLHDLLGSADVLVEGYRPGALAALGLQHDVLTRRYPRLVTVRLSAWGHEGPWAERRGFDSIVQAASGIAVVCGDGEQPGVLPAQVLDHATGHLVAAAALRGVTSRTVTGRPGHARLALARTAAWLLSGPPAGSPATASDPAGGSPYAVQLPSPLGSVTQIGPPGTLAGVPLRWSRGAHPWGTDLARWLEGGRAGSADMRR